MDSYEVTKQNAREKLKSALILVFGVGVLCGVGEYRQMMRATDMATIVFLRQQGEGTLSTTETAIAEEKPAEREQARVQNNNAVVEFLDALREVKDKVDAVERQAPVLDKIRQQSPEVVDTVPEKQLFEEGKLEIYDSDKGVVAVETVAPALQAENAVKEAAAVLAAKQQKQDAEADKIAQELTEKAQQVVQRAEKTATESGAVNMLPAGLGNPENKAEEAPETAHTPEVLEAPVVTEQVPVKRVENALKELRAEQTAGDNAQVQQQQQAAAEREVEKAVLENEAARPAPVAAGDKAPLLRVVNGEIVSDGDYSQRQSESGVQMVKALEHIDNTTKKEDGATGKEGEDGAVNMMKGIIPAAEN